MKRTLVLLITAIFILAACGNHGMTRVERGNQNITIVQIKYKEIATVKMYKVLTIVFIIVTI